MYKFLNEGKEIFVIAENESAARVKAKILPESEVIAVFMLNEDWS
jgi:hypothetical protein